MPIEITYHLFCVALGPMTLHVPMSNPLIGVPLPEDFNQRFNYDAQKASTSDHRYVIVDVINATSLHVNAMCHPMSGESCHPFFSPYEP